jgi:hypothetical protein
MERQATRPAQCAPRNYDQGALKRMHSAEAQALKALAREARRNKRKRVVKSSIAVLLATIGLTTATKAVPVSYTLTLDNNIGVPITSTLEIDQGYLDDWSVTGLGYQIRNCCSGEILLYAPPAGTLSQQLWLVFATEPNPGSLYGLTSALLDAANTSPGGFTGGSISLTPSVSATPLPATAMLFGSGLLGTMLLLRHRKRRA